MFQRSGAGTFVALLAAVSGYSSRVWFSGVLDPTRCRFTYVWFSGVLDPTRCRLTCVWFSGVLDPTRCRLTCLIFRGIGSDTVSFDVGSEPEAAVHTTIFAHNVWGIENLAHLGKVPPAGATVRALTSRYFLQARRSVTIRECDASLTSHRLQSRGFILTYWSLFTLIYRSIYLFQVHVFPMNIWQASGAPSRVVAFWGDGQTGHLHSAAISTRWSTFLMTSLVLVSICG